MICAAMKCIVSSAKLLLVLVFTCYARNSLVSNRIYGGDPMPIQLYPYQVQIVIIPKRPKEIVTPNCGGSIIGQRVVVTAGHCVYSSNNKEVDPNKYLVRAGTSYRYGNGSSLHRVARIILHEDYIKDKTTYRHLYLHNDIALLFLDPPFIFDETRQRIPVGDTPAATGDRAIASGWGAIDLDSKSKKRPDILQVTLLHIMDYDVCKAFTDWTEIVGPENLCAGVLGTSSTCKGDSGMIKTTDQGGPLAVNGRLVGLTSWVSGKYCVSLLRPPVFTNVSAFVPWIQDNTLDEDILYQ